MAASRKKLREIVAESEAARLQLAECLSVALRGVESLTGTLAGALEGRRLRTAADTALIKDALDRLDDIGRSLAREHDRGTPDPAFVRDQARTGGRVTRALLLTAALAQVGDSAPAAVENTWDALLGVAQVAELVLTTDEVVKSAPQREATRDLLSLSVEGWNKLREIHVAHPEHNGITVHMLTKRAGFDDTSEVVQRFAGLDLVLFEMEDPDLRGVDFDGLDLGGVNLSSADLRGSSFDGTSLRGADLRQIQWDSTLTRALDDGAVLWDESTVWPEGLDPGSAVSP